MKLLGIKRCKTYDLKGTSPMSNAQNNFRQQTKPQVWSDREDSIGYPGKPSGGLAALFEGNGILRSILHDKGYLVKLVRRAGGQATLGLR